ncbi:MAG: aromatic acid/H+ symport family MFS transporter [Steroidobacteraceae bacterium]
MMDARIERFRRILDSRNPSKFQYALLLLIALLLLSDGYDMQAIGYVAPALVDAWGVERPAFAPIFSMGLFGVMIGAMTMTPLADRIGGKRVLLGCTGVYGVLTLATALVRDVDALLLLRFATGIFLGGAMPNAIALVSEYAPTKMRALMVTIAVCGFSIGGAAGGVVATTMIGAFGWQAVFVVGGAVPLLILPLLILYLPESLPRLLSGKADARALKVLEKIAPGWTPQVDTDAGADAAASAPHRAAPVIGLFQNGLAPATSLIWVVYFSNLLILFTLSNWLPSIITLDGLPLQTANLATTFYQLGGTFGALLIAFLCDRFRAHRVLAFTFLGACASVFLIGSASGNPTLIALTIAAAGFCVVGGQNATNAFVSNFYPSDIRASGIGWALGIGRLGSILGPLLVGAAIAAGVETRTLFQFCAVPALVAAAAILLVGRVRPDRH